MFGVEFNINFILYCANVNEWAIGIYERADDHHQNTAMSYTNGTNIKRGRKICLSARVLWSSLICIKSGLTHIYTEHWAPLCNFNGNWLNYKPTTYVWTNDNNNNIKDFLFVSYFTISFPLMKFNQRDGHKIIFNNFKLTILDEWV